ncbi:hypothetical protein HYW74_00385 [Candidatus Pacearchaeota archaeon]|nr:hypothetical protein [Candidatus Pacearchaeota archaeon]
MKIQPYLEKLESSKQFKEFQGKNPKAYFSAGFFVLDFETKKNVHQIDFFIPKSKKIATFMLDSKVELKIADGTNNTTPKRIEGSINLDLDILKGIVEDEMKNNMVTTKLQKIIAVLQNLDGKLIWNLNCITTDMGVIKVHVDDATHSVLKFEKINLFDIVKKL